MELKERFVSHNINSQSTFKFSRRKKERRKQQKYGFATRFIYEENYVKRQGFVLPKTIYKNRLIYKLFKCKKKNKRKKTKSGIIELNQYIPKMSLRLMNLPMILR